MALPLILFSFPLGRLADRANRSKVLFSFTLIGALGSCLTAFAQNYAEIFATRMLVGLSYSAVSISSLSLIADLSSIATRGRYIMLVVLGQVFGGAACFAVAGALIDRLPVAVQGWAGVAAASPWRLVQVVFAVVLVVIAMVLLLLREPVRRELGEAANGNTKAALRELWRYRKILVPLMVGMLTINMADAGVGDLGGSCPHAGLPSATWRVRQLDGHDRSLCGRRRRRRWRLSL